MQSEIVRRLVWAGLLAGTGALATVASAVTETWRGCDTAMPGSPLCELNVSAASTPATALLPSARTSRPRTAPLAPSTSRTVSISPLVPMLPPPDAPSATAFTLRV